MTIVALGHVVSSDANSAKTTLDNIVTVSAPSGGVRNSLGDALNDLAVADNIDGAHVCLRVTCRVERCARHQKNTSVPGTCQLEFYRFA